MAVAYRHIDHGTEQISEINPCVYGQMIFDKSIKTIQ